MKTSFARYMLLLLVVGKTYAQWHPTNTHIHGYIHPDTYKKKYAATYPSIGIGFIYGKVNNVYAPGIYLDVISPSLGESKFSVGLDIIGLERKTSNTFGTLSKSPFISCSIIGLKCLYSFNLTEKILIRPGITLGLAYVSLTDWSNYYVSGSGNVGVATPGREYLFTVIPSLNFKYICTKGGGIMLSVKYQEFPFLGKHYFSIPQSNEGFMFSIGWEGVLPISRYQFYHRNDYHHHYYH